MKPKVLKGEPKLKKFKLLGCAHIQLGRGKGIMRKHFSVVVEAESPEKLLERANRGEIPLPRDIPQRSRVDSLRVRPFNPNSRTRRKIKASSTAPVTASVFKASDYRITPEAERLLRDKIRLETYP